MDHLGIIPIAEQEIPDRRDEPKLGDARWKALMVGRESDLLESSLTDRIAVGRRN